MSEVKINPVKTYATADNARKAVERAKLQNLRFFVYRTEDGRFAPIFLGTEAVLEGVHFFDFNVLA